MTNPISPNYCTPMIWWYTVVVVRSSGFSASTVGCPHLPIVRLSFPHKGDSMEPQQKPAALLLYYCRLHPILFFVRWRRIAKDEIRSRLTRHYSEFIVELSLLLIRGGIVLLNMMRQNFHSPSACLLTIQRFFKLTFSTPPPDLDVRVPVTVARANPQCPAVSTS